MRVYVLHNDYGTFSGEEAMVEAIADLLVDSGHTVRKRRISGIESRKPLDFVRAAYWSMVGDKRVYRNVEADLDEFVPDVVFMQNIYPRISSRVVGLLSRRNIPVVMRQANYRLFCPVGTASRDGGFCADCRYHGESRAVINNCSGSYPKSLIYALRHRRHARHLRDLHAYIAQTHYQKRVLKQVLDLPGRIDVIHNLVPAALFGPNDEAKWTTAGERLAVAFVGRRSELKGYDTFIELAERMPDVEFHSIGASSDRWDDRTRQLRNHTDHGFVSRSEIVDILRGCHCIAVPSRWPEGMPNVILEAFAAGCVPIVPAIGALPEIVGFGKFGVVVDSPSVESFEFGLSRIANRPLPAKKLARRGRAHVQSVHTRSAYQERLNSLLDSLERPSADMRDNPDVKDEPV